jgi:polysaccharide deacetylase family sporulation protein PdaB
VFITIRRKTLLIIALIVVIITAVSILLAGGAVGAAMARSGKKLPIYNVATEEKLIAITFDAAWGADKTEGILDILRTNDVKATFFLVGFWIDKYEAEVKLIDSRGMLIGNHSNNHLKMSVLKRENIIKELNYVNTRVHDLTGKEVKFFRAPFGDYNDTLIETVNELNMYTIQWDVDSLDWKGLSASDIAGRVLSRAENGSIVLFHNNSDNILEALPLIIPELKARGFTFVTLDDLVYQDKYYIDNKGTQHKN